MSSESIAPGEKTVDIRQLKERLRGKLPPDSAVLADLLSEPDSMSVARAEVLIPHYLKKLERELRNRDTSGQLRLRR